MYSDEITKKSPIRALENAMGGGLEAGELGVVVARAGVGKTACLVQLALDALLREQKVLHVHLGGNTIDEVRLWYDTLFADLAGLHELEDAPLVQRQLENNRIIHLFSTRYASANDVDSALELYAGNLGFEPSLIIVDGFDWTGPVVQTAALLGALKLCARRHGSALWMSAQSHRDQPVTHETGTPPPCDRYISELDAVLQLSPVTGHVHLQVLKSPHGDSSDEPLELHPHTMRIVTDTTDARQLALPPEFCTLLSGAARGAEDRATARCADSHRSPAAAWGGARQGRA